MVMLINNIVIAAMLNISNINKLFKMFVFTKL